MIHLCHPIYREGLNLIHKIFIPIILVALAVVFVGCNATSEPIAPPGQDQNNQQNLPGPPPPPGQTIPGDTEPLGVTVYRSADAGKVPFLVTFTTEAVGGLEPYKFIWDFDSDGITDAVEPNPSPLYAATGIYYVTLTVEDDFGSQAVETFEIEALEPTPNPVIVAIPPSGSAPLDVNFISEDSTPQVGASLVEYRWDFDADGIWDYVTSENNGNSSWTFDDPGNYYPVLRVYDNLGLWEEASIHILVNF